MQNKYLVQKKTGKDNHSEDRPKTQFKYFDGSSEPRCF